MQSLLGGKGFYKRLFALMLPIMIQNGITNFVNMLDNIMIGTVGTDQMTGVSIANQLFFVFHLCIFGAVSGAGIFGAQFFGKKDMDGIHYTIRFKFLFSVALTLCGIALFLFAEKPLLQMYLQGEQGVTDAAATMQYAFEYLLIMLVGLIPFSVVQCYSSTLRESGNPTLPMTAGVIAVLVNLVGNYILIFGKAGAPVLGVNGAAIATVASRFVELAIVVFFAHKNKKKYPFMTGAYRSFRVPRRLMSQFLVKGAPLMLNETMWAAGVAMVGQCYSFISLDAMAAVNICQTFWNVFSIAYMAVGAAIGIILGQMLGANQLKEAKVASYRLIGVSLVISVVVAVAYAICAQWIPLVYNTQPEIRSLATILMQITALAMPFEAVTHATYFTLRSGGKMMITIVFDCGFMWLGNVLIAFALSRFTTISFVGLFTIIQMIAVLKSVIGVLLVKKGAWVKNIT